MLRTSLRASLPVLRATPAIIAQTRTLSRLATRRPSTRVISTRPARNTICGRRWLSTEARSLIQGAVDGSPVVLFMKGTPSAPQCGFSRAVIQVLEMQGVPPEKLRAYNVLEDQELRDGIKEFSEWPTIPQVYVKGEFVGGCDIVLEMHQSGALEKLLKSEEII